MSKFTNELESEIDTISVKDIVEKKQSGEMVTHSCQRDEVWDKQKKIDYINCMFKGCKMSGLYANIDSMQTVEMLDGQNRGNAICDFVNNKLNIGNKDEAFYFKNLTEADKRKFLNIKLGITYLKDWSEDKCEDLFIDLQKGDPLTMGEKIQAYQSKNLVSQNTNSIIVKYNEFMTKPLSEGGLGLIDKRFRNWELITGLANMVIKKGYPVRIEKGGYGMFERYNKLLGSDDSVKLEQMNKQIIESYYTVDEILTTFKKLQPNCPKLKHKPTKAQIKNGVLDATEKTSIVRCLHFIYKSELYKQSITADIIKKFNNMITAIYTCNTPEDFERVKNIKDWAISSGNYGLIYETYNQYFK